MPGEHGYPILPLPLPKRGDSLEALSRSTAVQLFVARARQHKPAFELNEREAPAVAELVSRLEGIPLALELAAARVRSLSVADINKRLNDRFKILVGGDRVLQERQQTLRALVDWSYELLNETEQTVLNRLSVFAGGFDLEAAEQVCGTDPIDSLDVLDTLQSLVEKSLVMLDETGETSRYRMLETIRDYADEKLELSGESAGVAATHCEHYFALTKAARRGLEGPDQAQWVLRVETELDNVRSAAALALGGGVDAFIAVKFAVAMQGFWILRGYSTEGRALVRAALALPAIQASDLAQGHALYVGAALAESQSDRAEALSMLQTCLALRRGMGNPVEIAATLSTMSMVQLQLGDAHGAATGESEALDLFRQRGDRVGEAIGLLHLGQIAIYGGDDARAIIHLEQALAISRDIEHRELEAECELMLGEAAFEAGDDARAKQRFTGSLKVSQDAGDRRGEAQATWWLGRVELRGLDREAARNRLDAAIQMFRAFEMREELLGCLEDLAALAWTTGHSDVAIRVAASAASTRAKLGLHRAPRSEQRWQVELDNLRSGLSHEDFERSWSEGFEWQVSDAIRAAVQVDAASRPV